MGALWAHMAAYTTAQQFGPEAGRIAGMAVSIAFAAYGLSSGAGMIGQDNDAAWLEIGSAALSIGSATAGYAGNAGLAEVFSYAAMATTLVGDGEERLVAGGAAPADGSYEEYDIMGVGSRSKEDVIPGTGSTFLDILHAGVERVGISADPTEGADRYFADQIEANNALGVKTLIRAHSQGALLTKIVLGDLKSMGVDLSSTYVNINGAPISKLEFAGVISLQRVTVRNSFLDPVHNGFGALYNPVETAFGIASLPFTIPFHQAHTNYGF